MPCKWRLAQHSSQIASVTVIKTSGSLLEKPVGVLKLVSVYLEVSMIIHDCYIATNCIITIMRLLKIL